MTTSTEYTVVNGELQELTHSCAEPLCLSPLLKDLIGCHWHMSSTDAARMAKLKCRCNDGDRCNKQRGECNFGNVIKETSVQQFPTCRYWYSEDWEQKDPIIDCWLAPRAYDRYVYFDKRHIHMACRDMDYCNDEATVLKLMTAEDQCPDYPIGDRGAVEEEPMGYLTPTEPPPELQKILDEQHDDPTTKEDAIEFKMQASVVNIRPMYRRRKTDADLDDEPKPPVGVSSKGAALEKLIDEQLLDEHPLSSETRVSPERRRKTDANHGNGPTAPVGVSSKGAALDELIDEQLLDEQQLSSETRVSPQKAPVTGTETASSAAAALLVYASVLRAGLVVLFSWRV